MARQRSESGSERENPGGALIEALDVFDLVSTADRVKRAKRFPNVLFIRRYVCDNIPRADLRAFSDSQRTNFARQLRPHFRVSGVSGG